MMSVAHTLTNTLKEFEGYFTPHVIRNVKEIGRDEVERKYREGADAIIVDLDWEEQRYVGKKLHSIFFKPNTQLEGMKCMLAKFCKEIKLVSELDHKNVVTFVGVYYITAPSSENSFLLPVLVMEKMPFSLTKYIDTFRHIPETDIINILCDVARGLIYLHDDKRVVHGDLSSNNILLTSSFCAKIADFGSAQVVNQSRVSATPLVIQPGTPDFMPPEALIDPPCYTISVDVFSFGCVIIHMTTCKWPTPTVIVSEASELERRQEFILLMRNSHFLLSIVKKCLDIKEKRPSCRDLLLCLSEIRAAPKERDMDEDNLDQAYKMIRKIGLKETMQYLFNNALESSPLIPIQKDLHGIEPGDHLVYKTMSGWKIHFYVVANLGNGKIKVIGAFLEGNNDPFIEEKLVFDPNKAEQLKIDIKILYKAQIILGHGNISKKLYKAVANLNEEQERLEHFKMHRNKYSVLYNNSEHFVMFVKTGIAKCQMSKEIVNIFKKFLFVQAIESNNLDTFQSMIKSYKWMSATANSQYDDLLANEVRKNALLSATREVMVQVSKEVLEETSKAATLQSTVNAAKTIIAGQVSKELLEESGKAVTSHASKNAASVVAQVTKEAINQGATSTTSETIKNAAATAVQNNLKMSVVAGVAFESAMYSFKMSKAVYKHMKGQMDGEEFIGYTVEQTATSSGSAAGGISGSVAGAAAGAALGSVVPVLGTAVGGLLGGLIGGIGGGVGGSLLGKEAGRVVNSMRESKDWQLEIKNIGDIAICPNNQLIVVDQSVSQAFVFDGGLSLIKVLTFKGDGTITQPSCVAVCDVIAISDRKKHVVKIFSFEGTHLSTIGSKVGSKIGQFDYPLGLSFNSKRILYVVDFYNCRVQAFDTNKCNAFCGMVGSEGSNPGQYQHPEYIAIDNSDHVYVTDYSSNCINMYSGVDHIFLCKIGCNRPCTIAFSPDNHLIVGDYENNCLCMFGPPQKQRYSREMTSIFGNKGEDRGEFNEICGLAVNNQGTIYIADSKNDRLQIIGTSMWRKL
ncbi:uncharacterized protein [Dysidea avara]|uniref:uncharacterized protein isoform X2 n=1 Tax=Dysidea avara TaxID=196820 RepID=UPI00332B8F16